MATAFEQELSQSSLGSGGLGRSLTAHCGALLDLFLLAAGQGRPPTHAEVSGVADGLPVGGGSRSLAEVVRAVRAELRALREATEAGAAPAAGAALYEVGSRLAEVGDGVVDAATELRLQREAEEGAQGRRQLLETLLFGRYALSDQVRARAMGAGIDPAVRLAVVGGSAEGTRRSDSPERVLRVLADGLAAALRQHARTPFVVERGREVVAVVAWPPSLAEVRHGLEDLVERLGGRPGIRVSIGISGPCAGLIEVPIGYDEANRVLRRVAAQGGVASAGEISLLDYLVLQAGSGARRIVPAHARALVREDARWEGALLETLSAYLDNDLSVERTATALAVHPNTVYYRLGRITRLTGVPSRKVWALVDLLAGVQVLRAAEAPPPGGAAPLP